MSWTSSKSMGVRGWSRDIAKVRSISVGSWDIRLLTGLPRDVGGAEKWELIFSLLDTLTNSVLDKALPVVCSSILVR